MKDFKTKGTHIGSIRANRFRNAAIGLLLTWVDERGPVIRTRHAIFLYAGVVLATVLLAWKAGLTHSERRANKSP